VHGAIMRRGRAAVHRARTVESEGRTVPDLWERLFGHTGC
jgi:hypothetical protein